ncbi:F-box protein [Aspergillus saccharolyticus JOP 1030-1]|uniref:F-box domain-containing protein n=1 Tax=Aspergillus saccharolyticus JOP 1030-1 TaxID=1450539 RepID=A0A318ZUX7_9EURO|nr:hypothetical protein BP01DRAFT_363335 [Aspergillus saccharolyticus JOP 1030-1]PYH48163.1 hypothetical protein BP01DRAFT_363335 [Aspergillus saccharolyticus JOP 1030-1]
MDTLTLDDLPAEIFLLITEHMDFEALCALGRVSKSMREKAFAPWLGSLLHPLSIHLDVDNPKSVHLRPKETKLVRRTLPEDYEALQKAQQLVLEVHNHLWKNHDITRASLVALTRFLLSNKPSALQLQSLTLCAPPNIFKDFPHYDEVVPEIDLWDGGRRRRLSTLWVNLTQLIIHIPASVHSEKLLDGMVCIILDHAPRLQDFRFFYDRRLRHPQTWVSGLTIEHLAHLEPAPHLKRLEINDPRALLSATIINLFGKYGRSLEHIAVMTPGFNPNPDAVNRNRLPGLKAQCPVLKQLVYFENGRVALGGPELWVQRPLADDPDGPLSWVRADGSKEWFFKAANGRRRNIKAGLI